MKKKNGERKMNASTKRLVDALVEVKGILDGKIKAHTLEEVLKELE